MMTHSKPGLGGLVPCWGQEGGRNSARLQDKVLYLGGANLSLRRSRSSCGPSKVSLPPLQVEPELLQFCFLGWSLEGGGL